MLERQNKLLRGRVTEIRRLLQEEPKQKKELERKLLSITEITKQAVNTKDEAIIFD